MTTCCDLSQQRCHIPQKIAIIVAVLPVINPRDDLLQPEVRDPLVSQLYALQLHVLPAHGFAGPNPISSLPGDYDRAPLVLNYSVVSCQCRIIQGPFTRDQG